jgi:beta-exotoxin I transport system permease protein
MFAEFKHALGRLSGRIWGWGIGLGLYSLMLAYFFEIFTKSPQLSTLLASYPQDLLAFFGEMMSSATPIGYIDSYYYLYMTVILGIFAVGAGAAMLVEDEERGILDLVLAHPISRRALFCGRWLARSWPSTGCCAAWPP